MKKLIIFILLLSSSNIFASTDVVNKVFPATVLITAEDKNGQPQSLGSGFLIAPNIIATNFHVIENSYSGYVKFVNKKQIYEIEGVVGYDTSFDLALIKIGNNDGTPLPILSTQIDIGEKVFAIGNPLGLEGTISDGIISGLREFENFSALQISAPISPGNSGGPVVNEQGELIGVATFTFTEGQNINFAVPIKYVKELLDKNSPMITLSSTINNISKKNDSFKKDYNGLKLSKFEVTNYGRQINLTIKNNLRKDIKEIKTIWIVYDTDGEPLDYVRNYYYKSIKAKLGKRVTFNLPEESIWWLQNKKVIENFGYSTIVLDNFWKFVEFRVLDFEIVEE